MGRFFGKVGYANTQETSPGVWKDVVTEREYYGSVIRASQSWQTGENINDNSILNNQISIIADPYSFQNLHTMKYVKWMGAVWKISKIDISHPRLILTIGGIYNGESTPTPTDI